MIFYTEYDFKNLNILIDVTYIYPSGFSQTVIVRYYDIIIYKFIPGIYILINNKMKIGYSLIFKDILENIINFEKEINGKLNWKTWTTDFELSLINGFNKVFNEYNIIH